MNKRLNQTKWKSLVTGVLLAVSASGIIAAPAWAAEYSEGLVGTVKDDKALLKDAGTTVKLDKTTNTITYDFKGEDATFNVAEHDGIGLNTDAGDKNYTFNNVAEDGTYGTLHIYQKNTGRNDFAGVTGFSADKGKVIVNSNLDLTASSAYASVGISAANLADVLINGNVKMRKDDPESPWGIITKNVHGNVGPGGEVSMDGGYDANYTGARWNPAGFSIGYTGGNITVKGDVDIAVRGTAVRTDCYSPVADPETKEIIDPYDAAVISLVGSSIKIDTPYREENTVEGFGTFIEPYYSLASYGGTINVNVENMQAGNGKVEIVGNVLAMKRSEKYTYTSDVYQNGRINLALTTADSFWKGIIDNTNMCQNKDADKKGEAKYDSSVTPFFADHSGEVNLWLQNGAQWIYENASRKDGLDYTHMPEYSQPSYGSYDGISHLTTLVGGKDAASAGIIKMVDTDNIEIGSAEGVTKVWYDHNDATPASMIGGDVKVLTAKTGAEMLLYTGNNGLDKGFDAADAAADKNKVSEVLNSLAQKLWYMAGDTNLSGTVTIADGLTASSTSMKVGNITFSDGTNGTKEKGQGFYDYTPETDGNEQSKTEFSQGIFGVEKHDTEYAEGNVLQKDGTYRFTENTSISLGNDGYEIVDGSENAYDADIMGRPIRSHSVIAAIADATSDNIVIDAAGKELNLKIAGGEYDLDDDNSNVSLITASGTKDKTAEVNITAKNLNLSMPDDTMSQLGIGYAGYAIYADNNSRITIDGNVNMDMIDGMGIALGQMGGGDGNSEYSQNEVTIRGDLNITNAGAGINIGGGNSKVVIKGHTSIDNMRAKVGGASYEDPFGIGIFSVDGADDTLSDESTLSLGASDIEMAEGKSAVYGRKGTININTGADETQTGTTVIAGNVISDGGTINLALSDDKSYLKGRIQTNGGKINLSLSDGAYWDNQGTSKERAKLTKLNTLSGNNGNIYQNNGDNIDVVNYSGSHTVFYTHDENTPTSIIGGDFRITNAESGSTINLVTDRSGITSGFADTDTVVARNTVSEVLNKLAQKLFYTANDGNLSGSVAIADGLTASSASLKVGNITFSDGMNGTKTAGQGFYDYTPVSEKVYKTGPITGSEDISTSREANKDGIVTVKADTINVESKYTSALYAGSSTSYSSPMKVDLNGAGLSLESVADSKLAAAIYAGNNAWININNSSDTQKLSMTATNTSTTGAYGIYTNGSAHLNISGPVDIHDVTTKGDSAIGIHIQGQKSDVTIDGALTISNVKGARERGAGINAAGINVTGDSSSVTVTGPVDISGVRGSGILLKGADTKVSVGGGTITAVEDSDKSHNFYAARVEKGTLDINMKDGAAGSTTTKITGDMYVTGQYGKKVIEYSGGELIDWNDAGILNVALTDQDSFWKGVAAYDQYNSDYGAGGNTMHDIGQFNLYLQNGASWTNEQQSHATTTTIASKNPVWEGSTLAALAGGKDAAHSGYIFQKDSNPISVVNYSGYTTVFYEHDASDPTKMIGGDFNITNAAEGSNITLVTDNAGLTAGWNDGDAADAKDLVSKTLDSLAGKLFYKSYADGHLQGVVKIADGLTASSASLKVGDISFSTDATGTGVAGQGYYDYKPRNPGSQTDTEFTTAITGDAAVDTVYAEKGVLKDDGTYVFTQSDTTITPATANVIDMGAWGTKVAAAISGADGKHAVLDLKGNNLTVNSTSNAHTTGISAIGTGTVEINNAGAMNITAESTGSGQTGALFVNAGGTINIHNKDVLTLRAKSKQPANAAVIKLMNGKAGVMSSITIDGLVDVVADKAEASGANEAISAVASKVEIGGGSIKAINGAAYAIRAYGEFASQNRATVNVNVKKDAEGNVIGAGDNKVELEGDVFLGGGMDNGGAKADVSVGLNTKDSSWKGNVGMENFANGSENGVFNLYMGNGAGWTGNNISQNTVNASLTGGASWTGYSTDKAMNLGLNDGSIWNVTGNSKLKSFSGSDGSIVMSDASVDVADYSGSTTVIYKHDASDPTNIIGGSFTIAQAQDGASVKFLTDNEGITSGYSTADKAEAQNQVSEVLNKLAQKLFYTANDGKLSGSVTIADGLTASSKTLKTGNISFSTDETGTKTAGQGFYDYTPADDTVLTAKITGGNDAKYVNLGIEAEKGIYNFTQNTTINVTKGDYDSSLGAIESSSGPITINAEGKALDVSYKVASGSNVARTVATSNSYSVKNKDISIKADKLNLSADTTGFRAQTVYADGGTISIDADTTISTSAQTESNGIYAGSEGVVNMNGNLTIKEDSNASKYYALKADNNGVINVNIKDGKAGDGVVKINSDIFTKSQESYDYWDDETTTVTSTVNMALKGEDASWTGRHLYEANTSGDDSTSYGNFNLWLQDGASWTNEKTGKDIPSGFAGSHVTSFVGGSDAAHAGNIFQKDSNNLTIDSYSGNTNIYYAHEGNGEATENYKAGDTIITSAKDGSVVSLITDSTDVAMDSAKSVANVLNALAGKLTYSNFTKGENNLNGYVKIADGLTASSKALKTGDITFTEKGKGSYIPDHQVITEFTTKLTGDKATDTEYLMGGVIAADGTYKFTEASDIVVVNSIEAAKDLKVVADKTLSLKAEGATGSGYGILLNGAKNVDIQAETLKMEVKGTGINSNGLQGVRITDGDAKLNIKGNVDITANGDNNTIGIYNRGNVTIDGDVKLNIEGNGGGFQYYGATGLYATSSMGSTKGGIITVNGNVDFYGNANGLWSNAGGGEVNVKGGSIIVKEGQTKGYAAIKAENGTVNMNVVKDAEGNITGADTNDVTIKGNLSLDTGAVNSMDIHGTKSEINLGLTTEKSSLTGVIQNSFKDGGTVSGGVTFTGAANLWLQNGATWNNEVVDTIIKAPWGGEKWNGSHVANFVGGSDAAHAGSIFQKDENNLTIDSYSGNTNIYYAHTGNGEAAENYVAGDTIIKSAAEGSVVSLITDSTDVAMDNEYSVKRVLNALAGKLTYSNFVNGEENLTGYVKIADGLTASSKAMQAGDISFSKDDGKGSFKDGTLTPGIKYPDEQPEDKKDLSQGITGDTEKDYGFKQDGILKEDGSYVFTQDPTTITVDEGAAVSASNKNINIDTTKAKLELKGADAGVKADGADVNIKGNTDISGNVGIDVANGNVTLNGSSTINGTDAAINAGEGSNVYITTNNSILDIKGAINADGGNITVDSGKATSTINSDVNAANGGSVEINLNDAKSTLSGSYNVDDDSSIVMNITNGAVWTLTDDEDEAEVMSLMRMAKAPAAATTGLTVNGGATKEQSGYLDMTKRSKDVNIASYSGWETFIYAHENAGSNAEDYKNGNVIIDKAAAGSGVVLSTDNSGIDMTSKDAVEATLKALAQKVTYSDHEANASNLTGKVQIADGLTASSASKNIGDMTWAADGKGQYKDDSVNWSAIASGEITEGDYETFVMKGVRSAATTSLHTWRDNMQDTYTGADLADADGIFAKALGGKTSSDVKGVKDSNTYYGVQVGYDKAAGAGWHTGVAFDYRDGDSNYLLGGKGDNQMYSLGVYGVKNFADNSFFRVAAKVGRVENEYDVYNEIRSLKLHGDYKANAYGLTMEYGKTFGDEETYITPKAQLTWAQVGAKDYSAYTEKGARMDVDQDSYSSFVGRLGFEAGVKSEKGRVYAGLFAAHEFNGDIGASYFANDGARKHTSFDGEDTWMEMKLGGTYDFSKVSHFYADIAKDFGGDFERKWKLNAGVRFEF